MGASFSSSRGTYHETRGIPFIYSERYQLESGVTEQVYDPKRERDLQQIQGESKKKKSN